MVCVETIWELHTLTVMNSAWKIKDMLLACMKHEASSKNQWLQIVFQQVQPIGFLVVWVVEYQRHALALQKVPVVVWLDSIEIILMAGPFFIW